MPVDAPVAPRFCFRTAGRAASGAAPAPACARIRRAKSASNPRAAMAITRKEAYHQGGDRAAVMTPAGQRIGRALGNSPLRP